MSVEIWVLFIKQGVGIYSAGTVGWFKLTCILTKTVSNIFWCFVLMLHVEVLWVTIIRTKNIKTEAISMVPSLFIAPSQHSGPIQSPFSEARVIWGALTPSCHVSKEEIITEISNPNNSSWDNLHPENHIDHGKWIYRRKYLSGRTNMSGSVKSHISYWCNGRT